MHTKCNLQISEVGGGSTRVSGLVNSRYPRQFISNTTILNVLFHSDDSLVKTGFRATFRESTYAVNKIFKLMEFLNRLPKHLQLDLNSWLSASVYCDENYYIQA